MPNASGSSSARRSGPNRGGGGRPSGGRPSGGGRGRPNSGKPGGRSSAGRGSGGRSDSRGGSDSRRDGGRSDSRGGRSDSRDSRDRNSARGNRTSGSSYGRNDSGGYQGRKRRDDKPKAPPRAERSGWGSVAQHGAAGATVGQRMDEQDAEEKFSPDEQRKFQERQARRDKAAERHEGLREQARQAIDRGAMPTQTDVAKHAEVTVERMPLPGRPPKPLDVERLMVKVAGKEKGARGWRLFKRAAKEFQNEQFTDARKTIKPLIDAYPNASDLHELHGLCLYRLGKWDEAIEELETFRRLSGTAEQNPVLMDCPRALGNWADVEALWAELGELSPSAELVSEGRIVMAGSQADQGFVDSGVRTLEKGWKIPHEPMEHHLRRAYALADLLERDGKIPKSRKLFGWIASKSRESLRLWSQGIGLFPARNGEPRSRQRGRWGWP